MRSITRLNHLKAYIHELDIDIENGLIHNETIGENKGYYQTNVRNVPYKVHQIIAVAGGLDVYGKVINHIDGNPKNNRIDNLEAVTQLENVRHGYRIGLTNNQKHDYEKIYELRDRGLGHRKISNQLGIPMSTIQHILKKRA